MSWKELIKQWACSICRTLSKKTKCVDVPSPPDIIPHKNVIYNEAGKFVEISGVLPRVCFPTIADTNSMDGLMDFGHTVILSDNKYYLDNFLKVGTVIVWQKWDMNVIHQIVEVGRDDRWYCYTKGINCPTRDPWKIRREDIEWIALGIIW